MADTRSVGARVLATCTSYTNSQDSVFSYRQTLRWYLCMKRELACLILHNLQRKNPYIFT